MKKVMITNFFLILVIFIPACFADTNITNNYNTVNNYYYTYQNGQLVTTLTGNILCTRNSLMCANSSYIMSTQTVTYTSKRKHLRDK